MSAAIPVLVVEASQSVAKIIAGLLKQCGFPDVDISADGHTALRMMRGRRYGLVMADLCMAPINGIELLKAVRDDPFLQDTCFVLMTAMKEQSVLTAARQLAADGFLIKPFTRVFLKDKLSTLEKLKTYA